MKPFAIALSVASLTAACVLEDPYGTAEQQAVGVNDDPIGIPDIELPEPEPEPDPCPSNADVVSISSQVLDGQLRTLLVGTRIQLSHSYDNAVTGEPRQLTLKKNIPATKLDQLLDAMEASCASTPDPQGCFIEKVQSLNDPVVHTIVPQHASYIAWGGPIETATGETVQPLHIPVIQKTLINKWWLKYPLPVSVTKARCHLNDIGVHLENVNADNARFWASGNALFAQFDLSSPGPWLRCEGLGSFFGHGVGWADELFPDVNLKNATVTLAFGGFEAEDGKLRYSSASAYFDADLDLNNTPGLVEDTIDFFKDYRDRVRDKVQHKLRGALDDDDVRDGLAKALEVVAESTSGEPIDDRICDVTIGGGWIDVYFEPQAGTTPATPMVPATPMFPATPMKKL